MDIRLALIGRSVLFSGFDGKEYHGWIADVRRGVAVVKYHIRGEVFTAYVEDGSRLRIEV